MDEIRLQVGRARRWLILELFVRQLGRWAFVALSLAAALVLTERLIPFGHRGWTALIGYFGYVSPAWLTAEGFAWFWPIAAVVIALAGAGAMTWWKRARPLDAAMEVDRRFGLRERVSSSLSLSPVDRESNAGSLLLRDAQQRVSKLQMREKFRFQPSRWSLLPLAPGAIAVLLAVLLAAPQPPVSAAVEDQKLSQKQVTKAVKPIEKKLRQARRDAEKKLLPEAQKIFTKMEQELGDLSKSGQVDKKQALAKLNDLKKDVEKRREELGKSRDLLKQLNQLKPQGDGPADRMAEAMKNGDMKKALAEMEKLKNQIAKGELTPEQREKLAKQLQEMQEKLDEAAKNLDEARQQAKQDLEQQLRQAQREGDKDAAEKIQQQLEKLAQQQAQADKMKQMAEKMGQCAKCMKEGKNAEAAQQLEQMQGDLADIQKQLDEMDMLDQAMDELAQAKDQIAGRDKGQEGQGEDGDGEGGDGLGRGQGQGKRPEKKTDVKSYDTRVKQQETGGAAVVKGLTEGPNLSGGTPQDIKQELEAARVSEADPLVGQRLPKEYRDHTKGYFESLRKGQKGPAPKPVVKQPAEDDGGTVDSGAGDAGEDPAVE